MALRQKIAKSTKCRLIACCTAIYTALLNTALSQGIPDCTYGDNRVPVPIWSPAFDKEGYLLTEPPQKDGMIVYINIYAANHYHNCINAPKSKLYTFNKRTEFGGIEVNIKGNVQFANGVCYFKGYYMNEDVSGIHQGWISTYFEAVSKKELSISNKYCIENTYLK